MKRRTFLALGLTAALSLPFAMSAFADDVQYKNGQTVEFSGHTDFGYFFTYTSGNGKVNYKCFSVVNNGDRKYAAVNEDLYEYFKAVFNDKDVVFKGDFQKMADDGAPVISAYWEVQNTERVLHCIALKIMLLHCFMKSVQRQISNFLVNSMTLQLFPLQMMALT